MSILKDAYDYNFAIYREHTYIQKAICVYNLVASRNKWRRYQLDLDVLTRCITVKTTTTVWPCTGEKDVLHLSNSERTDLRFARRYCLPFGHLLGPSSKMIFCSQRLGDHRSIQPKCVPGNLMKVKVDRWENDHITQQSRAYWHIGFNKCHDVKRGPFLKRTARTLEQYY